MSLSDDTPEFVSEGIDAAVLSDSAVIEPVADEHVPDCVVLMNSRGGDGLGLSFKVNPSGRVFRLEPARDPNQPRFWCFRIYRCTSAGIADENERSWWGAGGMTRAELPDAVQVIRDNPDKWLANENLAELREWVLEPGTEPVTPARALGAKQKQTSR